MPDAEVLPLHRSLFVEAADLIEAHGWIQDDEHTEHGFCVTGAVKSCAPTMGEFIIYRTVMRMHHRAEEWNDELGRVKAEVVKWLRSRKELSTTDLYDTFGPCWSDVVQIVLRTSAAVYTSKHFNNECGATTYTMDTDLFSAFDTAKWVAQKATEHDPSGNAFRKNAWSAGAVSGGGTQMLKQSQDNRFGALAAWAAWGASCGYLTDFSDYGFSETDRDQLVAPWKQAISNCRCTPAPQA
jgi:hypothetical protein